MFSLLLALIDTYDRSDCGQFFLLPVVLGTSLLSLGCSNTLFAVSFGWYFYITHLGYRGERLLFHMHALKLHPSSCS